MREGVTLTHAYSNCPICMPTRFTWLTGLYAGQCSAGLLNNHHDWPLELSSMAGGLQKKGFYTALIGKLHSHAGLRYASLLKDRHETEARGFDYVFETSGKGLAYWYDCEFTKHLEEKGLLDEYRLDMHIRGRLKKDFGDPTFLDQEDTVDTLTGKRAAEWIQTYDRPDPFFLHVSLCGPHGPYDPPRNFRRKHRPEEMPDPEACDDPEEVKKAKKIRAAYTAMIEHVDSEIGRVWRALEDKGLLENTLILFATDHGDMMGHLGRYGKFTPYDTSIRTPYIVRFPDGRNAGIVLEGMVEAVDLPCTILSAAGWPDEDISTLLPQSPGRSFLAYARGDSRSHREEIYSECRTFDRPQAFRLLRDRDWKYVCTPDGEQLFDMVNDPWETENLADRSEHQVRIADMRLRLIRKMSASVPPNRPGATYADGDWWIEQPGHADKVAARLKEMGEDGA